MSDTTIKAIVIRGNFTRSEFATIVNAIRALDQQRPDGQFEITAMGNDVTVEQMVEVMTEALPARPDRLTKIVGVPS
jgi:hypothetical protein